MKSSKRSCACRDAAAGSCRPCCGPCDLKNRDESRRAIIDAVAGGDPSAVAALLAAAADRGALLQLSNAIDNVPSRTAFSDAPILLIAAAASLPETRRLAVVRLLVNGGASVNTIRRGVGGTALIAASANGAATIVQFLLRHGAHAARIRPAKVVDGVVVRSGASPLSIAALRGHADVVRCLLRSGRVRVDDMHGIGATALFAAALNGHLECARVLLDAGASPHLAKPSNGATPAFAAASNGHAAALELLLRAGASPRTVRRPDNVTALLVAAQNGHARCLELLLRAGAHADVDCAEPAFGATALIMACKNRHLACAALLLRAGADAAKCPPTKLSAAALLRRFHGVELRAVLDERLIGSPCEFRLARRAHLDVAAREAADGPLALRKGDAVALHGVQSDARLNGRIGRVLAPLRSSAPAPRYAVRLDGCAPRALAEHERVVLRCVALPLGGRAARRVLAFAPLVRVARLVRLRPRNVRPCRSPSDVVAEGAAAADAEGAAAAEAAARGVYGDVGGASMASEAEGVAGAVARWSMRDGTVVDYLRATNEHLVELRDASRTRMWLSLSDVTFRDWRLLRALGAARTARRAIAALVVSIARRAAPRAGGALGRCLAAMMASGDALTGVLLRFHVLPFLSVSALETGR